MIAASPDPLQHGWWLASRSAGVVALVLVTVSTLLGLAMALRPAWARRFTPRLVTLHEQLSITGLLAIAVHGVTLLGLSYYVRARPHRRERLARAAPAHDRRLGPRRHPHARRRQRSFYR